MRLIVRSPYSTGRSTFAVWLFGRDTPVDRITLVIKSRVVTSIQAIFAAQARRALT
jgi:hypothetical protein